jgi:hypothetical protein
VVPEAREPCEWKAWLMAWTWELEEMETMSCGVEGPESQIGTIEAGSLCMNE